MSTTEPVATLGLTAWRSSNNTKSILLLGAFPALLLLLLGVMSFIWGAMMEGGRYSYSDGYGTWQQFGLHSVLGTGTPLDFALSVVATWWPVVLGIAAIWLMIGYVFNDAIIHLATGAQPVSRTDQPDLYNLLENLCISRGLQMPKLYIIDTDVMNAYASGIDQKSYAITVTSGLLQALDRDELEAVLAHELTHIIDRDTRLLIITVVFVGMISFLAQLLWRSIRIAAFTRRRGRDGGGAILMVAIAAVVMFIGYLLALLLRFALSRRRELLADAGSVELTKNPDALIAALLKISKNAAMPHVPSEVKQMMFENPPSAFDFGGLLSTHPSIEKRVQILQGLGGRLPSEPASTAAPAIETATTPNAGPWTDSGTPPHHGPWG
jgi:heat shock protein HtpX